MTQFVVTNSGDVLKEVPIVNDATKASDIVFIQPKGRVTLPDGFSVAKQTLVRNKGVLGQVELATFRASRDHLANRASYYQQATAQAQSARPAPAPVAPAPVAAKSTGKE